MSTQLVQDVFGLFSGSLVGFSLGLVGGGGSILDTCRAADDLPRRRAECAHCHRHERSLDEWKRSPLDQ